MTTMALLTFLDDSRFEQTTSTGRTRNWYGYGGLAIPDRSLATFDTNFLTLRKTYGFPRRLPPGSNNLTLEKYCEVKYSPGKTQWMKTGLTDTRRARFIADLFKLVNSAEGSLLISCYDEGADDCGEREAKRRALENLYERITEAATKSTEIGIVICDFEGSGEQVTRLIAQATGIARIGTWYRQDIHTKLYPVLLTASSELHAGLQIADITMGIFRGMLCGETKYAPKHWESVQAALYRKQGVVRDWGLKIRSKDSSRIYRELGV